MLNELYISNFAIIDDLVIPFAGGLNVITGETGAGKSIIIQALGLILGDRASSDVVRSGANEAQVVAVFDGEDGEQTIIKRMVLANGKSRAFVNGLPVTLAELKEKSETLIEISSQHEHQRLLDTATHLGFVDRFGGTKELKENYKIIYTKHSELKNRLRELEKLSASAVEQREFLSYQINEISAANLKSGEDAELERERNLVKHSAKLFELVNGSESLLYSGEKSVLSALDDVHASLEDASKIDGKVNEWLELCHSAISSLDEVARGLRNYMDQLNVDPERIEQIEERIYNIQRLKRKYGGTLEDVLKLGAELEMKLKLIDNSGEEIEKVQSELAGTQKELKETALKLSKKRMDSVDAMTRAIQKELDSLGLKRTTFSPGHTKLELDDADETGIDRFNFEISPNAGEPLKPLNRIASGGELSRIMLAIKSILMKKIGLSSVEIFDEVDSGIGGAVAEVVGRKLKEMSSTRQIIAITHLPQVASFGDYHIRVVKETKAGRTTTGFNVLNEADRLNEIARMLGGVKITETTIEHAREMLNVCHPER